jgi:hypothetical protein
MALSRILAPKMDEVAVGWGRMHKVELHNLYSTPNIITVYQIHEDDTGE